MEADIIDVTKDHIRFVSQNMRKEDAIEVELSTGKSSGEVLLDSIEMSEFTATLMIKGEPAAIFGVAPIHRSILGHSIGAPWAITTTVVDKHPKEFFQGSKVGVELLRDRFDILINYVDAGYEKAIRWLKRLGFELGNPSPWGFARAPFRPFVWRKTNV